jgi:hypothetical protein
VRPITPAPRIAMEVESEVMIQRSYRLSTIASKARVMFEVRGKVGSQSRSVDIDAKTRTNMGEHAIVKKGQMMNKMQ